MAQIHIDENVISKVCNEDLIAVIQDLIHTELQKPESDIDTDFIEECVNAMLEIEQSQDNSFVALVPLVRRDDFINRILGRKHGGKAISKFARVAIVAATLTASTITANAAVEAVTGVNLIEQVGEKVQNKLQSWGLIDDTGIEVIEGVDDDGDEIVTMPTTELEATPDTTENINEESSTAPQLTTTTNPHTATTIHTTTAPVAATEDIGIEIIEGVDDDGDEVITTAPTTTTTQPTTEDLGIEIIEGVDDDDDEVITTTTSAATQSTTSAETIKPTTTNKYIPPTTENAVTEPYKPNAKVEMTGLKAEYDSSFKSDYIYGEKLSYDGLKLTAIYSDGSQQSVSIDDCSYTSGIDMNKTGDYTLTVSYKKATVRINITVRPDEDSRGSRICSNDDYDYLLTDNGAYITKYKGNEKNIILNTVDGNKVFAIAASVFADSDVETITAENVKKLFDNSFKNCKSLTIVTAPNAEYIGNSAFENCSKLVTAINSPKLTYIGEKAYKNTAITDIVIPSRITHISDSICEDCSSLEIVTLEGDVSVIGKYAFSECAKLEAVSGTGKIKSVGAHAFYNDTLVDFDTSLPQIKSAGEYAFAYCNSANITKLSGIEQIGQYAFAYCYNLKEVEIADTIRIIPEGAFRGAHISKLTLSEGVEEIEDCAFMSTEIVTLSLPDSLKKIGSYGLYSIKLKEAHFGKNIEYIGSSAFYKRKNLMFYVYDNTVPLDYAKDNSINYTLIK